VLDRLLLDAMFNLLVTSERILSAEGLFVIANLTSYFLPCSIVNCILMASEIVRTREDCVAGFSRRWVGPDAPMWALMSAWGGTM